MESEFYWNRDLLKKSIRTDNYIENKFEETRGYYKLNLEFPQYTKVFHWLLKARRGYKLDSTVLKAAKLILSVPFLNSDSRNVNNENSGNISGNNSSEIGLNNSSNKNYSKVFNFLLGGRRNNNREKIEFPFSIQQKLPRAPMLTIQLGRLVMPMIISVHMLILTERNRNSLSGSQT
ncbi:hypothetical protein PIROE2DRAFT_1753 [Piromyces sp. E2]|nr:hypothetical protein PIROE2DRAFT_1753 [Piromyces sp. E2]|eukprot:OUM70076.1 hypothetical protein PIROE2DRAFT_1753 [Piromyces sp. E2]